MNHIINDKNESVIAIGAPGSFERVKVEFPALIEKLNNLYWACYECYGHSVDEAVEIIRTAGIKNPMETNNLLLASDYSQDVGKGSATDLVLVVGRNTL